MVVVAIPGAVDSQKMRGDDVHEAYGQVDHDAGRVYGWLALSGNRWPEYFYNHVPFYSVLPDPNRFPCYHQLEPGPPLVVDRDGEGPRSPSMCADRIDDDLDELLLAAGLLIERRLPTTRRWPATSSASSGSSGAALR
jgi:hypothetical protein